MVRSSVSLRATVKEEEARARILLNISDGRRKNNTGHSTKVGSWLDPYSYQRTFLLEGKIEIFHLLPYGFSFAALGIATFSLICFSKRTWFPLFLNSFFYALHFK